MNIYKPAPLRAATTRWLRKIADRLDPQLAFEHRRLYRGPQPPRQGATTPDEPTPKDLAEAMKLSQTVRDQLAAAAGAQLGSGRGFIPRQTLATGAFQFGDQSIPLASVQVAQLDWGQRREAALAKLAQANTAFDAKRAGLRAAYRRGEISAQEAYMVDDLGRTCGR
jgi:hypothetical protein